MENFSIHIYNYGETQIISKELSIKFKTNKLKNVEPIINHIFSKKPKDNLTLITNFRVINIIGYNYVKWSCKESFEDNNDSDLKPLIDNLIQELQS